MFIASAKIPKSEEASHHADFMGNCLLVTGICFIYPGDEFFFLFLVQLNEMSTLD